MCKETAPPDEASNVVQTLMSVNNIDQTIFGDNDRSVSRKYFDKSFISKAVSANIHDAIASKSGARAKSAKLAKTQIPYDFVLDKTGLTDKEVDDRVHYYGNVFQKDLPDEAQQVAVADEATTATPPAAPAATEDTLEDTNGRIYRDEYKDRLNALRAFIQDLALPRMKEIFRLRAKKTVGKKYVDCESLEDYLREYRHGNYDNEKRAMVHTLCNLMWGKNCMQWIEKMVMDKLGLVYLDELIGSGKPKKPKTRRSAGNIAKMINRMRQTLFVDRFRKIGLELWGEVIYVRDMKVGKRVKGIVHLFKTTVDGFGFAGFLGVTEGHELLNTLNIQVAKESSAVTMTLEMFMENASKENSDKSIGQLLQDWRELQDQQAKPVEEVEVATRVDENSSESSTCASSITASPTGAENGAPIAKTSKNGAPAETGTRKKASSGLGQPGVAAANENKTSKKKAPKPAGANSANKGKRPSNDNGQGYSTPRKSKTNPLLALAPGERSPCKMANGTHCFGCDHNPMNLRAYNNSYFTEQYLERDNYPTSCNGCNKHFLDDKADIFPPRQGKNVMVCPNAINHRDHPCVFALCYKCWPVAASEELNGEGAMATKTGRRATAGVRRMY